MNLLAIFRSSWANRPVVVRLASFSDQAMISLGNFLMTIAMARIYPPVDFAGFGIGLAIALTFGGGYRTSFAVPNALMPKGRFLKRAAAIGTLHITLVSAAMVLIALISVGAFAMKSDELILATVLGLFACFPLYVSLENDRILAMRIAGPLLSLSISTVYVGVVAILVLCAWQFQLPFPALMVLFGLVALGKVAVSSALPGRFDWRHARHLLGFRLRHSVSWTVFGTITSAGFIHAPLWILSSLAAPIHAAAYTAMRTPLQPMQIVVRSLDLVDKIAFGNIDRTDRAARRRHAIRTYLMYVLISLGFAVAASLTAPQLIHLLLGERYVPFASTLIVWAFNFVLVISLNPLETVIYEAGLFRSYALAQATGGAVAVALAFPLASQYQSLGAAVACVIGISIPYCWTLLRFFKLIRPQ